MSWANLDDRLHAHPKVRRLQRIPFIGAEAFGIWCWALSWARSYSPLEGRLSVQDVACDWGADPAHMAEVFETLHSVGLVDQTGDAIPDPEHWVIHDWADWQLDGKAHQALAGKARAAGAGRSPAGTFLPAGPASTSTEKLDQAGIQPGHASPRLSTPRLSPRVPARETPIASDHELSEFQAKYAAAQSEWGPPPPHPAPADGLPRTITPLKVREIPVLPPPVLEVSPPALTDGNGTAHDDGAGIMGPAGIDGPGSAVLNQARGRRPTSRKA